MCLPGQRFGVLPTMAARHERCGEKERRRVKTDVLELGNAASTNAAPVSPRKARKPRCEDCFFHQNMLCALEDKKPCPTFRPAHPDGLRPPTQLSFVFRQSRRPESFWFDAPRA
jgi:hypothetical protein